MATVQDLIINPALRLVAGLTHAETPSQTESLAALEALNGIIDNLRTQHRKVFVIDHHEFPLVSGQQTYTMGPGGDFDVERPVKIQRAGVLYYKASDASDELEGIRKPLELIDSKRWAEIAEKGMQALEPLRLYDSEEYPLKSLHLWPIPICP